MNAMALSKRTENERTARKNAMNEATKLAIEVPLSTMRLSLESFTNIQKMADIGNPNSISDAGVGALCARAAVRGAYLNVKINVAGFEDKIYIETVLAEAEKMVLAAELFEKNIMTIVEKKIGL